MKRPLFLLCLSLTFIFGMKGISQHASAVISNETGHEAYQYTDEMLAEADAYTPPAKNQHAVPNKGVQIDLKQVFSGSPTIYMILISLSMLALFLTLYTNVRLKQYGTLSSMEMEQIYENAKERNWDRLLSLCHQKKSLLCRLVAAAVRNRGLDQDITSEIIRQEGKRATLSSWQRIGLLNDIAMIAPMLGLLGTVLGMFYAFYDINRSIASITTFFDGLGISVGTTVAGLIVALFALMMHTLCKHSLIRRLSIVEKEADSILQLIKNPPLD